MPRKIDAEEDLCCRKWGWRRFRRFRRRLGIAIFVDDFSVRVGLRLFQSHGAPADQARRIIVRNNPGRRYVFQHTPKSKTAKLPRSVPYRTNVGTADQVSGASRMQAPGKAGGVTTSHAQGDRRHRLSSGAKRRQGGRHAPR